MAIPNQIRCRNPTV